MPDVIEIISERVMQQYKLKETHHQVIKKSTCGKLVYIANPNHDSYNPNSTQWIAIFNDECKMVPQEEFA